MSSVSRWTVCPKCDEPTFNLDTYSSGESYGFCMHCGYYHDIYIKNYGHPEDGIVDVEGGGYGVETYLAETTGGGCTRSLKEGEIPEITENTIFASAIIDGKLTVLKQPEAEN